MMVLFSRRIRRTMGIAMRRYIGVQHVLRILRILREKIQFLRGKTIVSV